MEPSEPRATRETWRGFGLAMLLHLLQLLLGKLFFVSMFFIGVTQLVYLIPAILVAKHHGRLGMVRGLVIGGALTFLLNAMCGAAFWYAVTYGKLRIAG